jgi:hypothetical protein
MTRAQCHELGYIVLFATVPSILQHGILSHNRAAKLEHEDIALADVQDKRAKVIVPTPNGGRRLHDFANVYINARNPMLLKKSDIHHRTAVLRVSSNVLDIPGAVVTDMNAGSNYVHFSAAPNGLSIVDYDRTSAEWWSKHSDQRDIWRHSAQMCAEILVPNVIPAAHITGAFVVNEGAAQKLRALVPGLTVNVNARLFFK